MYKVPDKTSYLYFALLTSFPGPTTLSPCSCQNWNLWLSSLLGQGKIAVSPTSTCWTVIWLRTQSNTAAHMLNMTAAVVPIVCKKRLCNSTLMRVQRPRWLPWSVDQDLYSGSRVRGRPSTPKYLPHFKKRENCIFVINPITYTQIAHKIYFVELREPIKL